MGSTQPVKHGGKLNPSGTVQRTADRKGAEIPVAPRVPRTKEEMRPISKHKQWKLLYASCPLGSAEGGASPGKRSPAGVDAKEESGKHKGLCKNCKKRDTCELPKPEGGVWRCEDYE